MSPVWDSGVPPIYPAVGPLGWLRVLLRGPAIALVVVSGFLILVLARLIERPLCGLNRPVTPYIACAVGRAALWIMGLQRRVTGAPMAGRGAVVANHSSWLDILVLNASKRIYFVSKSEVAGWPGIGWMARAAGTVFIERTPAQAQVQTALFQQRLLAGHKLLFFPEGTSTDNRQVLPFKTTLFQAFFAPDLKDRISVQPVSLIYHAPKGADVRFYGWWGDQSLGGHLVQMLAAARHGTVEVNYLEALKVAEYPNRKALAQACERAVRADHAKGLRAG